MTKDEIILAQQARIEQLKELLDIARSYPETDIYRAIGIALATPDDLSALRAHDAAIWWGAAKTCHRIDTHNGAAFDCYKACKEYAEAIEKATMNTIKEKQMTETKPDAPAKGFAEIRRERVFEAINGERHYQETKWGDLVDHPQSVGAYLTLMRVHLSRAENAWAGANNNIEALDCLRKVLAIGVACGEQHGMPRRPDQLPTLRINPYSDDEHE